MNKNHFSVFEKQELWWCTFKRKVTIAKILQTNIWDALRNLVPFVQFKKHEKHPWKSLTFTALQPY